VELAAYGDLVARPETMKAAGKTLGFLRFAITDSDVTVPSLGPKMVCTKCGTIGADVRPNWLEKAKQ
jgi:hypothetical protein